MTNEVKNQQFPLSQKIGIIGGGQLGKMMILEAKKMGFYVAVLDPTASCPCHSICDYHIIANFDDENALKELGDLCDVITYEFEHIGVNQLEKLERNGKAVYPTCKSLKIIQNKITQKQALKNAGLPVPGFFEIETVDDIYRIRGNYPKILKAATGGYDGKGNWVINKPEEIQEVFNSVTGGSLPLMLEEFIPFEHEVSVLACRGINGETAIYPVGKNIHKDNILERTIVPAPISHKTEKNAIMLAEEVMRVFGGVGMFCVEMFVLQDGSIFINEVAPRPHNSGHYTIEACAVSQFEQHIRAISGLPLGSVKLISPVVMANILGAAGYEGKATVKGCNEVLMYEGLTLHIYGKEITKPKRKMGHLTVCGEDLDKCMAIANKASAKIEVIAKD